MKESLKFEEKGFLTLKFMNQSFMSKWIFYLKKEGLLRKDQNSNNENNFESIEIIISEDNNNGNGKEEVKKKKK